eukprot:9427753-Pyramimonas_sp.AAC.1
MQVEAQLKPMADQVMQMQQMMEAMMMRDAIRSSATGATATGHHPAPSTPQPPTPPTAAPRSPPSLTPTQPCTPIPLMETTTQDTSAGWITVKERAAAFESGSEGGQFSLGPRQRS